MRHSFIVTSYNVAPWIGRCIDSLRACVRRGDEVIIIDDGSTDGTSDVVAALADAGGFGPEVALNIILLGTNTHGGVGIPANIGLRRASGEAVFFVDGDDWLDPAAFLACRNTFEAAAPDILIGNYLEHDEVSNCQRPPADAPRWQGLAQAKNLESRRALALALIAVPWRKFYRRDFLTRHDIRFPEGDFFFEDNPFHWDVCLKAKTLMLVDRVLCFHRVNRPGQTMASTGQELLAFFTHYETITAKLAPDATGLRASAIIWLVNNMTWHIPLLDTSVQWAYAKRAAGVLGAYDPDLWKHRILPEFRDTAIGSLVDLLHRGDTGSVMTLWATEQLNRSISDMGSEIERLKEEVTRLGRESTLNGQTLKQAADGVESFRQIAEYQSLRDLLKAGDPAP